MCWSLTWCQHLNEHTDLIVRLRNQKQMWKHVWFGLQMSVFPLNSFLSVHKECKQLINSQILMSCQVFPRPTRSSQRRKSGDRAKSAEGGGRVWLLGRPRKPLMTNFKFSLQHIFCCASQIQSFNYKDMLDFVHTSKSICTTLSALCEVTVHNQNFWTSGSAVRNT